MKRIITFSLIIFFCISANSQNTCNCSVTTCSQIWMTHNLQNTTYRNGDPIPFVDNQAIWANLTTGAYCYPNGDSSNVAVYGLLYNWYAVNDPRGLAPWTYHIPSYSEFLSLSNCLGGDLVSGGKMKETGLIHWLNPNTGATNFSGFTALPAGFREAVQSPGGTYFVFRDWGLYWTSTSESSPNAWSGYLYHNSSRFNRDINSKRYGFSVRCIKD